MLTTLATLAAPVVVLTIFAIVVCEIWDVWDRIASSSKAAFVAQWPNLILTGR